MAVQQNLQLSTEQWNRNVHILNLITVGQMQFIDGQSNRNVLQMFNGCMAILNTIGPLFEDEEVRMVDDKDGVPKPRKSTYKGLNTHRFHVYIYNLGRANDYVVAACNPDYDRQTRHQASQLAYEILLSQGFQLLQDVNALGFNSKHKNPGHNAGISGS